MGKGARGCGRHQPVQGARDPGRGDEDRGERSGDVDGKIGVVAAIGDRVATDISLVQARDHVSLRIKSALGSGQLWVRLVSQPNMIRRASDARLTPSLRGAATRR